MTDWSKFYDETRAAWLAAPPKKPRTSVSITRRTGFFNHYIGPGSPGFAAKPHSACLRQIKTWQAYHQSKGWKDIGYNALICQHGKCIEGRGLGYSGSHCPGFNTSGFGVQFMVAGSEKPTDVAYARMRKLYDALVKEKGGALAKKGHRDGVATTCPGDIVYAWVKKGMPYPTSTAPTPPESPTTTPTPTPVRTLYYNPSKILTGTDIKRLQSELNRVFPTYSKLTVDGKFGPATERVVKEFQRRAELVVDGRVGPATCKKMASYGLKLL